MGIDDIYFGQDVLLNPHLIPFSLLIASSAFMPTTSREIPCVLPLHPPFDIPYYGIATGKFRRYFDPKNFSDPFRVIKGMRESRKYLKEIKPDVLFSKGGLHTQTAYSPAW